MIPVVVKNESNQLNIDGLLEQADELKNGIKASVKKRCCCRFDDLIFARLDQARHILTETFDGRHVLLDGPDGNKIDCMFFPCTAKEKVFIDESVSIDGSKIVGRQQASVWPATEAEEPKYLSKATVIMCNPNALYY